MNRFKRFIQVGGRAIFVAALFLVPVVAQAQALHADASTNLSLTIAETLTITAPASEAFVGYNSAAGTAATGTFNVVTTANLAAGHTWLVLHAWLGSQAAALAGPVNISSSNIFAVINGASQVPCNDSEGGGATGEPSLGVANAGCGTSGIAVITNISSGAYNNSQTDTWQLLISGEPNLPASSSGYAGVINFESDAY